MPYIVTTKRPAPGFYSAVEAIDPALFGPVAAAEVSVSRRAVATLEEAKLEVARVAQDSGHFNWSDPAYIDAKVPESGGTIGPLPDGTVIEVEQTTWGALSAAVVLDRPTGTLEQALLDAFNARETRT